jgi:FKBP-type peptidyl-prolyl cis-trans isomerase 2
MDFDGNFQFRGLLDIEAIKRRILSFDESLWLDDVAKTTKVHQKSRGIFLKNDIKPQHFYGTIHNADTELAEASNVILKELRKQFTAGYFIRSQFSRHQAGDGFDPHTDAFSFTLMNSHRMHLPIISNDQVWLSVGNEKKIMAPGEVWEINNSRTHAGLNEGSTARVHMIIDFARPLYSLEDRIKYFLNLESISRKCGLLLCRPELEDDSAPRPLTDRLEEIPPALGRVGPNLVIGINYTLLDTDRMEVLSAEKSQEPLNFVYGVGQLPPKFEKALLGLRVDDTFQVSLKPEEGYGKKHLPLTIEKDSYGLTTGANVITIKDESMLLNVKRLEDNVLSVDGSHPFSGKNLTLVGKIKSIRALDEDEGRYTVYEGPTLPRWENMMRVLEQSLGLAKQKNN